jgi:hypothetical protein
LRPVGAWYTNPSIDPTRHCAELPRDNFSCWTNHFVVDNVGDACNMERIPQEMRLLMAREVKQ